MVIFKLIQDRQLKWLKKCRKVLYSPLTGYVLVSLYFGQR